MDEKFDFNGCARDNLDLLAQRCGFRIVHNEGGFRQCALFDQSDGMVHFGTWSQMTHFCKGVIYGRTGTINEGGL